MEKYKRLLITYAPFIVFFLSLVYWYIRDFAGKGMFSYGDRPPFPASFQGGLESNLNAWNELLPGVTLPQLHLYPFIETAFTALTFGNSVLAQKLFFQLPLVLSFSFMYFFLGKLNISSKISKFIGSLIFSVNLAGLGEIAGGAPGPLLANAFIPLLAWLLYVSATKIGTQHWLLILALTTFISFVFSDHILIFLGLFISILFLLEVIFERRTKIIFLRNMIILFTILLMLALSYVPIFSQLSNYSSQDTKGEIYKSLYADVNYSYGGFSPITFFSLGGGSAYPQIFGGPHFWGYLIYVVPVLSVAGLYFGFKTRRKWTIFLGLISLTLFIFAWFTSLRITLPLFKLFPLLFRFRNTAKLVILLAFPLGAFVAILWEKVAQVLQRRRVVFYFISSIFLVYYSVAVYPFVYGHVVNSKNIVPEYYKNISHLVAKERLNGYTRTLYLPWNYEVQKRLFRYDNLANGLFLGYGQYSQGFYGDLLLDLYKAFEKGDLPVLQKSFAASKTGLVIIDKNMSSNKVGVTSAGNVFATPYITGDVERFKSLVTETEMFSRILENGDFIIFKSRLGPQELEFYSSKKDLFVENSTGYFKIIADQNLDLENSIYNVLKLTDTTKVQEMSYKPLYQDNRIFEDNFSSGPSGNIWKIPVPPHTKGIYQLQGYPLQSKYNIPPDSVIEFKLSTVSTSGRVGLWDESQNGFWFLGYKKSDSVAPFFRAEVKNGNKVYSTDLGPNDQKEHLFKMEWYHDKVKFFIDGKQFTEVNSVLENPLQVQINGDKDDLFGISRVSATSIASNRIWLPTKVEDTQKFKVDYKINKEGLNKYKVSLSKPLSNKFVLVFNHPFSNKWKAEFNGSRIGSFPANGIYNGFEITGYNGGSILIYYEAQEERNLLLIYTFIVLLIVVFSILLNRKKYYD